VPSCPMLGIEPPFPQLALPSTVGKDPLTDQSSDKRQCISHQEALIPTQQPFSTSTEDPFWVTWNNWHKQRVEEAEEESDLECPEASIPRDTQERMVKPISSTQHNTVIIEDHLDSTIREDSTLL
jgi:hypothetical protein